MNSASPLPSLEHIIRTRWYGGCLGQLARYLDDRSNDNLILARIPNSSQVVPVMKGMLGRMAKLHVHKDILDSGTDEPRHVMYATYGGSKDFPTTAADRPAVGTSGIIATLERRLIFCQNERTFSLVEGMCFWGWIGMKDRVAWKLHNGVLKDNSGQFALPHDADEEASECWKRIESYWARQNASLGLSQQFGAIEKRFVVVEPMAITRENIFGTWTMFEPIV